MRISKLLGGNRPPSAIINGSSVTGYTSFIVANSFGNVNGCVRLLSGALTAGALKTLLSINGSGEINLLSISCMDATSRTMRLKISIDGVVVFDSTCAATAAGGYGGHAIGATTYIGTGNIAPSPFGKVVFNSSLLVEIASSLTETDKVAVLAVYQIN
jgi:hypothetical protein